jgi:hypothetical protein
MAASGVKGWQFPKVTATGGNPFRSQFVATLNVPDERWITGSTMFRGDG